MKGVLKERVDPIDRIKHLNIYTKGAFGSSLGNIMEFRKGSKKKEKEEKNDPEFFYLFGFIRNDKLYDYL